MSTPRSGRSSAALHPTREQLDELDALLKRMLDLPGGPAEIDPQDLQIQSGPGNGSSTMESSTSRTGNDPALQPARPVEPLNPVIRSHGPMVQKPHFLQKTSKWDEAVDPDKTGEDWVPLRSSWQPSPQTWGPLAETWRQVQQGEAISETILRQDDPVGSTDNLKDQCQAAVEPNRTINPFPTVQPPKRYQPVKPVHQSQTGTNEPVKKALPTECRFKKPSTGVPSIPTPLTPGKVPVETTSVSPPSDQKPATPAEDRFAVRPLLWLNQGFDLMVGWAGPPGRWLTGFSGHTFLGYLGIVCLVGAVAMLTLDLLGWT